MNVINETVSNENKIRYTEKIPIKKVKYSVSFIIRKQVYHDKPSKYVDSMC